MSSCDCNIEVESREQSRVLIVLIAINAVMFLVELVTGILAESTGLLADSLDMLADAIVYGVGLYAVGRALSVKINAAYASGIFQLGLAAVIALDIGRRALFGSDPEPSFMVLVSVIALLANVVCVALLAKHRDGEVHMRASWVFSANDALANIGVMLGGVLVYVFGARWPDLVVGLVIVGLVVRGGIVIVADARQERRRAVV